MRLWLAIVSSLLSLNTWAQSTQPPTTIPEPDTLLLIGLGIAVLIAIRKRKK